MVGGIILEHRDNTILLEDKHYIKETEMQVVDDDLYNKYCQELTNLEKYCHLSSLSMRVPRTWGIQCVRFNIDGKIVTYENPYYLSLLLLTGRHSSDIELTDLFGDYNFELVADILKSLDVCDIPKNIVNGILFSLCPDFSSFAKYVLECLNFKTIHEYMTHDEEIKRIAHENTQVLKLARTTNKILK